jgi:ribosomal protein L40E
MTDSHYICPKCGRRKEWRSTQCWGCRYPNSRHVYGEKVEVVSATVQTPEERMTPMQHMEAIISQCRGTVS